MAGYILFPHPSDEQIAAWIDGGLVDGELDDVESHLVNCEPCQVLAGEVILDMLEEHRSDAS